MSDAASQSLEGILENQKKAFTAARPEPLSQRRDRIKRAISILSEHGESLAEAMNSDFGSRSYEGSMMTDIVSTIGFGKYCLKNLDHWAAPDKRSVRFPLGLMGAKAEVRYEPKGVVGIMSPWNFPVNLSFGPLMQVLAAGNRAMIKPSQTLVLIMVVFPAIIIIFFFFGRATVGIRQRRNGCCCCCCCYFAIINIARGKC